MIGDTLIWQGRVAIPPDFLGLNIQTYPNAFPTTNVKPPFEYQIYRVWDHKTADNKYCLWAQQNPSDGVYYWDQLDAIVNQVKADGKKGHYTLMSCPTWLAKVPLQGTPDAYGYLGGSSPPTNLAKVTAFITALLTRYPGFFKYFEIWNEPDFVTPGNTFYQGTPTELAQLAKTVYQAVKAMDPSIVVLSPSDWSAGTYCFVPFLTASDGATGTGKDWIDGLCWHPYYRYFYWDKYWYTTFGYDMRVFLAALRTALVPTGLSATFPIYNGEVGYASDRFDPNLAASTPAELAMWAKRLAIGWAALGIKRIQFYAYETINSGNPLQNKVVSDAWNDIGTKLPGKVMTQAFLTSDGQFRIVTESGTFIL